MALGLRGVPLPGLLRMEPEPHWSVSLRQPGLRCLDIGRWSRRGADQGPFPDRPSFASMVPRPRISMGDRVQLAASELQCSAGWLLADGSSNGSGLGLRREFSPGSHPPHREPALRFPAQFQSPGHPGAGHGRALHPTQCRSGLEASVVGQTQNSFHDSPLPDDQPRSGRRIL